MKWRPLLSSQFRFLVLSRRGCLSSGGTVEVCKVSPECFFSQSLLSCLLLIDVYYPYFSLRLHLSRTMSALSLLIAVSALVCRYKSRLTAALIFIGGLILALFWLLNRWVA